MRHDPVLPMFDLPLVVTPKPVSEPARLAKNAQRVLAYLEQHGSATNVELIPVGGTRAPARCWEINRRFERTGDPRRIVTTRLHGGTWEYRLVRS